VPATDVPAELLLRKSADKSHSLVVDLYCHDDKSHSLVVDWYRVDALNKTLSRGCAAQPAPASDSESVAWKTFGHWGRVTVQSRAAVTSGPLDVYSLIREITNPWSSP
jgi:hypothetical protein